MPARQTASTNDDGTARIAMLKSSTRATSGDPPTRSRQLEQRLRRAGSSGVCGALELGREDDASALGRRHDPLDRRDRDADVEADHGEPEPSGDVDLRLERLDALVERSSRVPAGAGGRRIRRSPRARARAGRRVDGSRAPRPDRGAGSHATVWWPTTSSPGPSSTAATRSSSSRACEATRQPLVREGERRRPQSHRRSPFPIPNQGSDSVFIPPRDPPVKAAATATQLRDALQVARRTTARRSRAGTPRRPLPTSGTRSSQLTRGRSRTPGRT